MTLAYDTRYKLYQPVVLTADFNVPFPLYDVADLAIYVDGSETALYTVAATFSGGVSTDAVVTLNTAVTGVDVEIYGARLPRRENDYLANSPDLADNLQRDIEATTAVQQEQARDFTSVFKTSAQAPITGVMAGSIADRADTVPAFSPDGTGLVVGPSISDIASAQSYAAQAAASLDEFDDKYLGSFSTAPLTDNDGDPLSEGALYWNSATSILHIYSAGAWQAGYVGEGNFVSRADPLIDGPLDTNGHPVDWSQGADVAAASELLVLRDGNSFDITGTGTVATIENTADAWPVGAYIRLKFEDEVTLTNSADLALIGGADITTAAGDCAVFQKYASGDWRMASFNGISATADWQAGTSTKPSLASPANVKAAVDALNPFYAGHLIAKDIKASGTDGGSSVTGVWTKRDLPSSPEVNRIAGASIASSVLTLPVGKYKVLITCPVYRGLLHQARLQNTSDGVTAIAGSSKRASSGYDGSNESRIVGEVTVSGSSKTFEVQHWVQSGSATTGFGIATSSGIDEVYTILEIWKVG